MKKARKLSTSWFFPAAFYPRSLSMRDYVGGSKRLGLDRTSKPSRGQLSPVSSFIKGYMRPTNHTWVGYRSGRGVLHASGLAISVASVALKALGIQHGSVVFVQSYLRRWFSNAERATSRGVSFMPSESRNGDSHLAAAIAEVKLYDPSQPRNPLTGFRTWS